MYKTEYISVLGGMVKYTERKENSSYKLTAVAVDPQTRRSLGFSANRASVRSEKDLTVKKEQVVARASQAIRAKKKTTRFHTPKQESLDPNSSVREAFIALNMNDSRIAAKWPRESNRKFGFRAFKYSVLPFLEAHDGYLTRAEVEELYKLRKEEAGKTMWSKNNVSNHENDASWTLRAASVIYNVLRQDHPDFPFIDFSPVHRMKRIQTEQVKALPEHIRKELVKYLESHLESEPLYVRATVLMFSGAARTAEAAAVYASMIEDSRNFGVLYIRGQEVDATISPYAKSRAGYRNVTLPFWSIHMIRLCNAIIMDYAAPDRAPLKSDDLSAWIRNALKECGVDNALFDAFERLMVEEPDLNDDGTKSYDIHAYILRRDCSVRWLNICGITSDDVDYYLGHRNDLSVAEQSNFKTANQHRQNAQLLENYVYNPQVTRHPFLHPVLVSNYAQKESFGPACAYAFGVADSGPHTLTISGSTAEVGSEVKIRVPKGVTPVISTIVPPRCNMGNHRPAIGKQAKQFISNYSEECENNE